MNTGTPRLIVAGTKGDSGKTIVSLGLLWALRERGFPTCAFKKGPDFIDAAWLGWAAGGVGRNLDTFIMGADRTRRSFYQHAHSDRINLIEGNRGLHDGSDEHGTHSTAELAKLLQAPLVLVLPIPKTTRTAAAWVLGCQQLDPEMNLAGVIINQCAGQRHERVTRRAIESITGIPVVGAIPNLQSDLIPNRHLGLVTLAEFGQSDAIKIELARVGREYVDMDRIVEICYSAPALAIEPDCETRAPSDGSGLTIGMISDSAFTFYYPENLEALTATGATIKKISALETASLPKNLDALIIGGGFPETHLEPLCANRKLMEDIKLAVEQGLPVYAECGGLMYLSKTVEYNGVTYPLSGVLPIDMKVYNKPQGHGYCEVLADRANPFFTEGERLCGHEFHYSAIVSDRSKLNSAFAVKRGTGCFEKRDGIVYKNVLASYIHLHVVGSPNWADGIVNRARQVRENRQCLKENPGRMVNGHAGVE